MPFAISDKDSCCSVHRRFRDDILAEIRVNVFKKKLYKLSVSAGELSTFSDM